MPNEVQENLTQSNEPEKPRQIRIISIVITWKKKYIAFAIVVHKDAWLKVIAWFRARWEWLKGIIKFIYWFL